MRKYWLSSFHGSLEFSQPKSNYSMKQFKKLTMKWILGVGKSNHKEYLTNIYLYKNQWIEYSHLNRLHWLSVVTIKIVISFQQHDSQTLGSQSDRWALEHSSLPFLGVPDSSKELIFFPANETVRWCALDFWKSVFVSKISFKKKKTAYGSKLMYQRKPQELVRMRIGMDSIISISFVGMRLEFLLLVVGTQQKISQFLQGTSVLAHRVGGRSFTWRNILDLSKNDKGPTGKCYEKIWKDEDFISEFTEKKCVCFC